jgi:hypothetical protein
LKRTQIGDNFFSHIDQMLDEAKKGIDFDKAEVYMKDGGKQLCIMLMKDGFAVGEIEAQAKVIA